MLRYSHAQHGPSRDTGVGQNIRDHILAGPTYMYAVDVTTHSSLGNPTVGNAEYLQTRKGLLTNPAADLLGFEKLVNGTLTASTRAALNAAFPSDWPDMVT